MDDLRRALFHSIYRYLTSYNADFLITFSNLRKNSKSYSNHTKKNSEEVLEKNILQICNYKKKSFDIFIVESSKKKFEEVEAKLSSITQKYGINFDSSILAVEHLKELKDSFKNYYSEKKSSVSSEKLLADFFKIKSKYNKSKIPNMNRLTANGLAKFDDWFINGYVSYKHIIGFSRKNLNLPAGKTDEKSLFKLFGYLPSETDCFSDGAMKYIKKLINTSDFTIHKLAMMLEYYKGNKIEEIKNYGYKPPYEYFLLGSKRNIDRQFLIYLSLALGLSINEIKSLFKKCNCVLTDFLKEDILLCFFAENNYLIESKQRGNLFRYLWESI